MSHPDTHLDIMTDAAQRAGAILKGMFARLDTLRVEAKKASDFVSEADLAAEQAVFDVLKAAYPDYGFHLEEGGIVEGADTHYQWVVDPLDGTTNFLHGIPHFSVSVGLLRDGRPCAGVVMNPVLGEIFAAEEGQGATMNGEPIRVGTNERHDLPKLVLGTGLPFRDKAGHEDFAREIIGPMKTTAGIRRFGSAALDLAYVACGRFDGFFERDLSPWDVAAGIAIVREAGGVVTGIEGDDEDLPVRSILATNAALRPVLSEIILTKGHGI